MTDLLSPPPKAERIVLNFGQKNRLWELVKAEYTTSDMSDREFAQRATKTLGFVCNASHVGACRAESDIDSKKERQAKAAAEAAKLVPVTLEQRVSNLEKAVSRLIDLVGAK